MSSIHMILTAKGGVGKSWTAAVLANYLHQTSGPLYCADTDPSNRTFSSIKFFGAEHINIMTHDMGIDRRQFDRLIDALISHDGNCVVDNGSSSFLPLMAYMLENRVIELLQAQGHTVYIHAILAGGSGMEETVHGLEALLEYQPAKIVVWLNEYYDGPVIRNGKHFTDSSLYIRNAARFAGVIRLPKRSSDTFEKDLTAMAIAKQTFTEAIISPDYLTMARLRLKQVYSDICHQLDQLKL